jgi:PKD repeat protein
LNTLAVRIAALAALACLFAAAPAFADQDEGPSFSWSPSLPYSQDVVTFTSGSTSSSQTWSFGPKATPSTATGRSVNVEFSKGGAYNVTLTAGGDQRVKTVWVLNRKPVAAFTATPAQPAPGQAVTFDGGGSTDADGSVSQWKWDWNNDGEIDATGKTPSHSFARGHRTVTLRVVDDQGATSAPQTLALLVDSPPSAAFLFAPRNPVPGEAVTFTSNASSDGGSIASQTWDLDGDGAFDDGTAASQSFAYAAGSYTAALRVVDDLGVSSTTFQTFTVAAPAPSGDGSHGGGAPAGGEVLGVRRGSGVLSFSPSPFIRIKGHTTGRGARIELFTVRAPSGATVTVRCKGKLCPFKLRKARVSRRSTGVVRFRAVEKMLRAGIVLEVRVTKPGYVGKFTRFRIGRLKAPVRWDGCLVPGRSAPSDCQGGV